MADNQGLLNLTAEQHEELHGWTQSAAAAPPGPIHGQQRSGVRIKSRRQYRVVPESAAARAVFCVDEKAAIQALDRSDPVLPLSPGRAERHGFEYSQHGTLSLYAALNMKTGAVEGRTAQRHTSAEFVPFLA